MIPPVACLQEPAKPEPGGMPMSLTSALAFRQGGLILLDPPAPDAWRKALATERAQDLADDLLIRWEKTVTPELSLLGVREPGVHLLAPDGRRLEWWSTPPSDLPGALRSAGWKSLDDQYAELLRANPERVDLAWAKLDRSQARWLRAPTEARAETCASDLDRLLGLEYWSTGRSVFLKPEKEAPASVPKPLERAAMRHMPALVALIRAQPEAVAAWNLVAFLLPFHPAPPRLDQLLRDLAPGPETDVAFWPLSEAVSLAVEQRRAAKDWAGLRAFALARMEAIEAREARFHPSAAEAWSGRLVVTNEKVTRFSRRDEARAGKGYWLALWLEAALETGSASQAEEAARRLAAEGDGSGRVRGMLLCRQKGREDLASVLHEAR